MNLFARRNLLTSLVFAFVLLPLASAADTVYLYDGKSVSGKIQKLEKDKLEIRTSKGVVEYGRDVVKYFSIVQAGPDGKPRVVKAMFKPQPIKMRFELETRHYIVKTDTTGLVCKKAAKAMEELYHAYTAIFRPDKAAAQKAEVIIFENRADFQKYAARLRATPRKDTLGFFRCASDGSSQIVTYKRRTSEFHTLSTLYHEATHQFIMMAVGRTNPPPLWVNEGLAVYFEGSRMRNGTLKTGVIPRKRLILLRNALRTGKYIRLADLVKRGRDTYDALAYSEGWSLVYFFLKSNHGAYKKRFSNYFRALRNGTDHDEAFQTHLTRDMVRLETLWKKYFLSLKVPKK